MVGIYYTAFGLIGPLIGARSLNWRFAIGGIVLLFLGGTVHRQAAK